MFADTAFAPDKNDDGDLIVMLRADRLCDYVAHPPVPMQDDETTAKRVA
jgi:hypothetical protein